MWNRHNVQKWSQTYIGIRKHEIGSGTKLLFTFLSLKVFRQKERERHTIFLCWLLLHRQLSTQPMRGARSAQIRLPSPSSQWRLSRSHVGTQLTAFLKSQPTLPVRDVTHIPWSQFLSRIFILKSLNDTSSLHARKHLCSYCT